MKNILFIITCLFTISLYGQGKYDSTLIRQEIHSILDSIKEPDELHLVDCKNNFTKEFHYYDTLRKTATENELRILLNHPKQDVRAYAFNSLAQIDSIDIYKIILNHLRDAGCIASVNTSCMFYSSADPCLYSNTAYYMENVTSKYFVSLLNDYSYNNYTKLTPSQIHFIDSLTIYDSTIKTSLHDALERHKAKDNYYDRIEDLFHQKNKYALVTMAKYQKEKDIKDILNPPKFSEYSYFPKGYQYEAISYFTHPAFLPFLEEEIDTYDIPNYSHETLFTAIANYKNKEACTLLQKALVKQLQIDTNNSYYRNGEQSRRTSQLMVIVNSNLDSCYIPLLIDLYKKGYTLPESFFYLNKSYPDTVLKYSKLLLMDSIRLQVTNDYKSRDLKDSTIKLIFENIKDKDSVFLVRELVSFLMSTNKNRLLCARNYFSFLETWQKEEFIQPLLHFLEHSEYYLEDAVKLLLAYHNSSVNKKIKIISETGEETYQKYTIKRVLKENLDLE